MLRGKDELLGEQDLVFGGKETEAVVGGEILMLGEGEENPAEHLEMGCMHKQPEWPPQGSEGFLAAVRLNTRAGVQECPRHVHVPTASQKQKEKWSRSVRHHPEEVSSLSSHDTPQRETSTPTFTGNFQQKYVTYRVTKIER